MAGCGADKEANELIASLTAGEDFVIPEIDLSGDEFKFPIDLDGPLYKDITPVTIEGLTERKPKGKGVFDALMESVSNHVLVEFEKGRITGADYSKTYTAALEAALANGVAFLLGKDEAFWNAQTAQIQAFTARVGLETAKVQLASMQLEALNQKANYAMTKMKLATESKTYCTADYNLTVMLPQQLVNLKGQAALSTLQEKLVKEQTEAQRGQTADTRTDGLPVNGVMGKQKSLYDQQITSYQRNSEVSAAKLFTDAWITQKTLDEGLVPPNGFTNASLDTILTQLKLKNGLN